MLSKKFQKPKFAGKDGGGGKNHAVIDEDDSDMEDEEEEESGEEEEEGSDEEVPLHALYDTYDEVRFLFTFFIQLFI